MQAEGESQRKRGRPSEGAREAIVAATQQLLEERGLARLTTRAVARTAGVSEASIFYHFGDKTALVAAALEASLESLRTFADVLPGRAGEGDLEQTLRQIVVRWERFFDGTLPVLAAVEGDAELGADFREYMLAHDYGVHRGVDVIAQYLEAEQRLGRVNAQVDPHAAAMLLLGPSFLRALQSTLLGARATARVPSPARSVAVLIRALASPPAGRRTGGRTTKENS